MNLDNLSLDMIDLNKQFRTKEEAIRFCGKKLVNAGCVDEHYVTAMLERNEMVSVYMGNFIAIPHGTDEAKKYVQKSGICVVQVPEGINFGTEENPQIVTVIFGIAGKGDEHLSLIQQTALYCSDMDNVAHLADAQSKKELLDLLLTA